MGLGDNVESSVYISRLKHKAKMTLGSNYEYSINKVLRSTCHCRNFHNEIQAPKTGTDIMRDHKAKREMVRGKIDIDSSSLFTHRNCFQR